MRLLRLRVQDFGGISAREVRFLSPGVTVIEGPNESGKTTLVRAFDLLLDALESSVSRAVLAVRPVGSLEGPRVEAEFVTGGYRVFYAKGWFGRQGTEARITDPSGRTESLAGRAAHDRVSALVQDTTDVALWRALRMSQEDPLHSPTVGKSPSLRAALDRAASGSLGGAKADDLFEKAREERLRYYTPTGKPTASYRDAQQALERAAGALKAAQERWAEVEAAVTRIETTRVRREETRADLGEARQEVERTAKAQTAVREARDRVRDRGQVAQLADATLQASRAAVGARDDLVHRECEARSRYDERIGKARDAQDRLQALAERREVAQHRYEEAQQAVRQAEEAQAEADAAVEHWARLGRIAELRGRLGRITQAETRLLEIEAALEGLQVDDVDLERLTRLERERTKAEARLEAGRARLRLTAERDLRFEANHEADTLAAGEVLERAVEGRLELRVEGLFRLTFEGAGSVSTLARAAEETRRSLEAALAAVHCHALEEARECHRTRVTLEAEQVLVRQALERDLGGETPDLLSGRLESLDEKEDAYRTAHGAEEPGTLADEGAAEARRETAREAADAARAVESQTRADLDALDRETIRLETQVQSLAGEATEARAEAAERTRDLAAARAQVADEDLGERAQADDARLRAARVEEEAATVALRALDPEGTEQEERSARARVDRLETSLLAMTESLNRDEGFLRAHTASGTGAADELAATLADYDRAQRTLTSVRVRAEAADLLWQTLNRHREAALRAYREPYRQETERLGRMVFGPDFAVELDDDLAIASRHLEGLTLAYDQLSTGAKEQLGVVARLACAHLVSGEGAPIVLDDAFSYSDPTRLARLCLALDSAGEVGQVILLTCTPDRYRQIGAASVVTVDRQHAPTSPAVPLQVAAAAREVAPARTSLEGEPLATGTPASQRPEEQILLILRQRPGEALARQDILALAPGLAADWSRTIRVLLESGRVTSTGTKRGTRYQIGG